MKKKPLTDSECAKLRELLQAPFVQHWLEWGMANRPKMGIGKTNEEVAHQSKRAQGWEEALEFLQECFLNQIPQKVAPKDGVINFEDEEKKG